MKILIFVDKLSTTPTIDETDTLIEAKSVKKALKSLGHIVYIKQFELNKEKILKTIDTISPNLIFNLVETLYGSDTLHLAPLLFEKLGIKYTGGNSNSLYLTGNKTYTKHFLKEIQVKTPISYYTNIGLLNNNLINKPIILKPKSEEASCSIDDASVTTFESKTQLIDYLKRNKEKFVEEYIDGKEFSVSVLNINSKIVVFPVAKMEFIDFDKNKPKILNYKSKWEENSFEYKHTQRTFNLETENESLIKQIRDISKKCFRRLGSKGYLRIDFRVDENDKPYVIDINMNPCISEDSGFVAAAYQSGINYKKLINLIITEAINE